MDPEHTIFGFEPLTLFSQQVFVAAKDLCGAPDCEDICDRGRDQAAFYWLDGFRCQGRNSCSPLHGRSAMPASTSASQASGLISLSFAVAIEVVIPAPRAPSLSEATSQYPEAGARS